jgi:two-component system, OmpR family, sensor histidine kinase KdpD
MHRVKAAMRVMASVGVVGLVTAGYVAGLNVNPTTAALSYLIVILLIATGWGITEAIAASVVAVLCLNYFFLPPVGTFTIADPQNWLALTAFLVTAVVTSQLSARARQRTVEAVARQRDLERLYALSRALLLSERGASIAGRIARHVAESFELPSVGVYDQRADAITWAGSQELPAMDAKLREVARTGASWHDPSGVIITAIQLGGAPIGSLAVADLTLTDTVLQSVASLAAIGLERARAIEATARAEAARESSELRATVLDALAHEFKTPLTSMKAASSGLMASASATPQDRELATILDEDVDRFQALVSDAVQMLRIDAGDFVVHQERHRLPAILASITERLQPRLEGHLLIQHVPSDLTVEADRELLALALRQLVDNALKYSLPNSTIQIDATADGTVDIAVHNTGSTIPPAEQSRIFERFFRGSLGRGVPGTGMGLAIVQQIARAHGGGVTVTSSAETGTTFTLSLPRKGRSS